MESFIYLLSLLILLWLGHLAYVYWTAQKTVGRSIDPLVELFPDLERPQVSLVFFTSPNCAPCKKMASIIRELAQETGRTYTIDVTNEVTAAQAMGIRATPTMLIIREGQVEKLFLGSKSKQALKELLGD